MFARQYENFLVECLIKWVSTSIQPGYRYQFKSPDSSNSQYLHQALLDAGHGESIVLDGQSLFFIDCNGVKLIPVLHGDCETGFTDNYISRLRDLVASRSGEFSQAALFIIHNSMLDTLINSAMDVAAPGAVWHPRMIEKKLAGLIPPGVNKRLSLCLLEDQLKMITEDGASVFGFKPLFNSLSSGKLDFVELDLFEDPFILQMENQPIQIRKRLDENRKLRREIEFDIDNYADQLDSVLTKFSPKFINEHFVESKDWSTLDFETFLDEIRANNSPKLLFDGIYCLGGALWQRAKSATQSGKKDLSLLIQVPAGKTNADLEFAFLGNDLKDEHVRISHNKALREQAIRSISRAGGKFSRLRMSIPFDGKPCFFSVELKRENRAEEYKFRLLLIEENSFYLEEVKHRYRIEPQRCQLTLLLEENELKLSSLNGITYELNDDNEIIDCQQYAKVDFDALANQSELIQFSLKSGEYLLPINVEGPSAEESITLPLLFNQDRFYKLFKLKSNAEYNRSKRRVIIDNSEYAVVGVRQQLLEFEADVVDEKYIYVGNNESSLKLEVIKDSTPGLYQAYLEVFSYCALNKTLPSLVAWDDAYCTLVERVLETFEFELEKIALNQVLSTEHKRLLFIGIHEHDGKERLSPFHPLVLAYNLQLVQAIRLESDTLGTGSFADLPPVTLARLVASGLLPFVHHGIHNFAYLAPVKENCFWLDIIPQRQASHDYVQRLVQDKLAEFTDAYSRLFTCGGNSGLIINAINQGPAEELFHGLIDYFKQSKEDATPIHVNCYDACLVQNAFDQFAETGSYEELKNWLKLNGGALRADADMLIDLIRSRLTYSKFVTPAGDEKLAYAHLAFFSNNVPVDCRSVNIGEALSGVLCDGMLAGDAAETQGDNAFFTAFGLRHVEVSPHRSLRLARLLGSLWQPGRQNNTQYLGQGIGLAVSSDFKQLLIRSYDSALWTTIIDPKVTLDFFATQKDVVLIHYSDQYTSSAGYDAITVTKQVELFQRLLHKDSDVSDARLLAEFNAFNGEWLLKMLTSPDKDRKEKHGIIGAYKFVRAMLRNSDICWVPLSVAEMIRVSGNVGLKMSESEFSRHLQGYRKGAISDDVLFVGFKDDKLYLLPLEVKTGVRPDFNYAGQQARELKRYLQEDVLGPDTLAARLYRALFIRQVLMQVEKFRLYNVFNVEELEPLLSKREWWLKGDYILGAISDYIDGFVLAHVENNSCFEPRYHETESRILQIELPYSLLRSLITAKSNEDLDELVHNCRVPTEYLLGQTQTSEVQLNQNASPVTQNELAADALNEIAEAGGSTTTPTTQLPSTEIQASGPLQVLFGHDAIHQLPLYWEPTNTAKFMNTNTGIIGTMGTGKTQFTKSLVTQLMRQQAGNVNGAAIGLLIFDYKSDYVDDAFVQANQVKRLRLHQLPYNPLSLYGEIPMLPVHTATAFAETMAQAFGLGQKQQLRLRKLILDAYEQVGIDKSKPATWQLPAPTIALIWELFLDQEKVEEDSLYAALDSLATYEIFEPHSDRVGSLYDLLEGVTVIELAGYSPQIQNLIVALTLDLFYSQMQKRGKPAVQGDYRQITKMILVDEADNFMKQDFQSLRKILKEGREYGVGVILSTQEITHFKTGENNYASYILAWVIHRVAEIKNSDIKAIFNVDDKGDQESLMESIRKLDKHFSIYIDGSKKIQKIRDRAFWEIQAEAKKG
jgi:DNA phosphorothioation-dependent restriction protein DptH